MVLGTKNSAHHQPDFMSSLIYSQNKNTISDPSITSFLDLTPFIFLNFLVKLFLTTPSHISIIIDFILQIEDLLIYILMEIRRSSRYNTGLVPKSIGKRNNTTKITQSKLQKQESSTTNDDKQVFDFQSHQASRFIKDTKPTKTQFKKFVTLLYRGLYYAVNNLKGPSQEFIKKKSVNLPEPKNSKKKFLLLDLDETLIHSVFTAEKTDIAFTFKGDEFKFNIRPHCLEFLSRMNEYFTIYVFTASTSDYAEPIVNYLNEKKKTIHGILHRRNCMETHNGFYIKDLRIIKNRSLKDMIIVDNLVHSFGLQLENGIPILEYLKGKNDNQLTAMEPMLIEMSQVDDTRQYLRKKLNLKKILQTPEDDFINFGEDQRRHRTLKM